MFINELLDGYEMGGRRPPLRYQPSIKDGLRYVAEVYEGNERRGDVSLIIRSDGDAVAIWTGDVRIGRKRYGVVRGEGADKKNIFFGNIAPLKIYEDKDGRDKRKLYVITEGFFHLQGSSAYESLTGPAYVTGWIAKNYEAEGKLSIPLFVDGGMAIFDWGPVEPTDE